MMDSEMFFVF